MTTTLPETVDEFHRGKFVVVQPKSSGHRSGIDAMLIAAVVPGDFRGSLADFGSGAGAAGLAVASRCAQASVTLIESDPVMAQFARRTVLHEMNSTFASRLSVMQADVSLSGKQRVDSGLHDRSFDFVIMNPPFNSSRDRATKDEMKARAHVMTDGMLEAWLRTAAAVLRPNGSMALIARPQSLPEIFEACKGRFGGLEMLPVQPRPNEAAIRIIARGTKGSRALLSLLPPLILHDTECHSYLPDAEATINGLRPLFDSPLQRGK
jgi:tRNA1(Val) A37 N6-methylase TrmN6